MRREERREKFIRLAEARVSRAMQAIRVVGNLSNRSNYDFSDDDVKKISRALNVEIEAMQARFKRADSKARPEFKL
jgi:energy-converting hydrogenase A subunit M